MTLLALLLSSTLFGGMMLYSFGFAPLLFAQLPAEAAGRLLRVAFPWYYLFVLATALLAALVLSPRDPVAGAAMVAVAGLGVLARQGLMPRINAARDAHTAGEAAAKRRFDRLHRASVVLNFVQLAAVGWVLARFI